MIRLSKTDPNERNCWGHEFRWTDDHRSAAQLRPMIYTYDSLADECLRRLDKIAPGTSAPQSRETQGTPKRDLYALLRDHADDDPKLKQLWTEVNTVPEWVDWEQVRRGQEVFYRYGLPILNSVSAHRTVDYVGILNVQLTFESLLGGM